MLVVVVVVLVVLVVVVVVVVVVAVLVVVLIDRASVTDPPKSRLEQPKVQDARAMHTTCTMRTTRPVAYGH